jgi:hypothetical protein
MVSLISKALGGACDKAQPMTLREIVEMLGANPRKVCHLGVSEDLLARFDGYHCFDPSQSLKSLKFQECGCDSNASSAGRPFLAILMVRTASTSKMPIEVGGPGKKQS